MSYNHFDTLPAVVPSKLWGDFESSPGQRLVFGYGALRKVGVEARHLGSRRVLVVSDRGVGGAGHLEAALEALRSAKVETVVFDQAEEDPDSGSVEEAARALGREKLDCILGLGGGSAMDTAKALNFLLCCGGSMEDYRGFGKAHRPLYPSLGIPTTAGTGSEAQSYAVISRSSDHMKMACGDAMARFQTVILDPDLLRTAPEHVLNAAAFDAISHSLESLASTAASPLSQMFSCWSWKLLTPACEVSTSERTAALLGQMMLGAYLAGQAVEHSMLGAAHACANPLSARYGVRHGRAVALFLPGVVRLNGRVAGYDALDGIESDQPWEVLARRLEGLRCRLNLPASLRELAVNPDSLDEMARLATEQWTGTFNPVKLTFQTARSLYEEVL